MAAIAFIVIATAARVAVDPYVFGAQFFTFCLAVTVSTFVGGACVGLLAVVLSTLSAWYFLVPPYSFGLVAGEGPALIAFAVVGSLVVFLIGALQEASIMIADSRAHIAELATQERLERRFRQVVESAPSAMVMVNKAGVVEMVNAQTEHLFGYAREELVGQPVEMLVPERFRPYLPGLRRSFFADPQARPMGPGRDLFAKRKDASEFPVEIGLNPIETDEGTMVLSAVVDISDRKQKEDRIQAALREKDVLLSEIHHRVANNLQIIISLLGLQSANIDDSHVQELLREGQNRIRSMSMIHQTLYRSEDFAEVDFGRFLDVLVPALVSSYATNHSRIGVEIEPTSVMLPIDLAIPCGLAVNELISNALKHAFPGNRHGRIGVSVDQDQHNHVLLSVVDDGAGMPHEFDATATTTLGLQLVSTLTGQLRGTLDINPCNPTRFTLRFPRPAPRN